MSTNVKDITSSALKLPRRSRALIADLLLDSLEEGAAKSYEEEWIEVARNRDTELTESTIESTDHEKIMTAAREAVRCSR
mgnify:CR=1 FL=1